MNQGQQTAGVFQRHAFVNHGQLQVCIGVIHRNAAVFSQHNKEEGNAGQYARHSEIHSVEAQRHAAQGGAAGVQHVGQNRQHNHRLYKSSDIHLAAAAHATKGSGSIHGGHSHEEST